MSKVSIEFGHTYALKDGLYMRGMPNQGAELSRGPTPFESKCIVQGDLAAQLAKEQGLDVVKHVLIDDVEVSFRQQHSQDSWRWEIQRQRAREAVRQTYQPDQIHEEGKLVHNALGNIAKLKESHGQGNRVRVTTRTGEQKIKLQGYSGVEDASHPSCDVLDLTWHQKRADESEILVTVLHKGYEAQQARVHALAELITDHSLERASCATLFLNDNGDPIKFVKWSERNEAAQLYFDSLAATINQDAVIT